MFGIQWFNLYFRPRLLYFLVYKTADPNFWKMGKKIKSENRLFLNILFPTALQNERNEKKNDPVWVRLRIKSSKYNQRWFTYITEIGIFFNVTQYVPVLLWALLKIYLITDNRKISVSKMSTASKFISESVTQLYCLTCLLY